MGYAPPASDAEGCGMTFKSALARGYWGACWFMLLANFSGIGGLESNLA